MYSAVTAERSNTITRSRRAALDQWGLKSQLAAGGHRRSQETIVNVLSGLLELETSKPKRKAWRIISLYGWGHAADIIHNERME